MPPETTPPAPDDTAAPPAPVEPPAEDAQAEDAPPAAPPVAAPVAEPARNFGPDWQGERTVDVEATAKSGTATVVVGEFAGSVAAVGLVKGDEESPVEFRVRPEAVGVTTVEVDDVGSGPVVLRLHISS